MTKAQQTASILVVDDDPEIVTMLSTRLGKRGYKVSTANDGHQRARAREARAARTSSCST